MNQSSTLYSCNLCRSKPSAMCGCLDKFLQRSWRITYMIYSESPSTWTNLYYTPKNTYLYQWTMVMRNSIFTLYLMYRSCIFYWMCRYTNKSSYYRTAWIISQRLYQCYSTLLYNCFASFDLYQWSLGRKWNCTTKWIVQLMCTSKYCFMCKRYCRNRTIASWIIYY